NVAFVLGLGVLTALAGCNTTRFPSLRGTDRTAGPMPTEVPTVPALVEYLNTNSQKVQAVRCDELDITCTMGIQRVGLRGKLMCQRPRNFRMNAEHWGK